MINSLAGEVPRPAYTVSRPAALSIDRAHEKGRRCVSALAVKTVQLGGIPLPPASG